MLHVVVEGQGSALPYHNNANLFIYKLACECTLIDYKASLSANPVHSSSNVPPFTCQELSAMLRSHLVC